MAATNTTTNFSLNLTDFDKIPWGEEEHNNWHILDAVMARFITVSNIKGAWENALAVVVGDRYIDTDADTIYEVLIAHTTPSAGTFAAARAAASTQWQNISVDVTAKGTYAQNTAYNPNDFVIDGDRYGVVQSTYTSDNTAATAALSYDIDVAADNIVTLIDGSDLVDIVFSANGLLTRTAAGAYAGRTITGGTGITATNGDGVSDNPSLAVDTSVVVTLTGSQSLTNKTLTAPTINGVIGGTQASATITTLTATDVNSTNLDGIIGADTKRAAGFTTCALTGDLTGTTATFTGIVDGITPVSGSDFTTKSYVDTLALGVGRRGTVTLTDTGSNVALGSGLANGQTLDGVTIATNDTILLRNQTNTAHNGIYDAPSSGTASRNSEYNTYDENVGAVIHVQEGSAGANLLYHCTSNVGGTLDSTALVWANIVPGGTLSNVVEDTTPQLGGFLDANSKFISHAQGANIASVAGDTNIWTNFDGNTVHITGTNAITDFGTPKSAGDSMWLIFDAAASVVDSATITVAGNTNYQAAANDLALVYALTTSTFLFMPFPNSGASPVAAAGGGGWLGEGASGTAVGNSGDIIRVNQQTLDTSQSMTGTDNGSCTGPFAIASGVTLTLADGATFKVL